MLLAARTAGLGAEEDCGRIVVPEPAVTTFTLDTAGWRHVATVVGLTLEPSARRGRSPGGSPPPRRRLRHFQSRLLNPDARLADARLADARLADVTTGATAAYRSSTLAAFATPSQAPGFGVTGSHRSWELAPSRPPASRVPGGGCRVLRGRGLAKVLSMARGAREATGRRSGGAW